MERVKIGVVGVGHLGDHHARIISQLPEAELVGVVDIDQEKARRAAEKYQARYFEKLEDLLSEVDAVNLVVPTTVHYPLALMILDRGKNLLVEKPITETVPQAEEIIDLAQRKGLILQVGHIERFNPVFKALKKYQPNPKFIESHRLAQFDPRGTDVAVILDLMIHDLDLILNLVKSPPKQIEAAGVGVIAESEDICNARLTFENGCVANVTASRISARALRKMRLFQRDSYISLDFFTKTMEVYRLVEAESLSEEEKKGKTVVGNIPVEKVGKTVIYERPKVEEQDMLTAEIKSFVNSITTQTPPVVSGEDGKRALEVALKIKEKAEEQKKEARLGNS
jgi:predicted dehydrogenase